MRLPGEDGFDLCRRCPVADSGLVARATEIIERQSLGKVDEGARNGCDRDAAPRDPVTRVQSSRAVGPDAFDAT
jgi:hypothetical protein